ncbi:MAG TPA: hypothetical protein VK882_02925 [Nitrososphaeraceae archaeon]|jgi:hypothetical protein|nr:hypothetical protein [Nitrososphaeraceae archaeon]
MKDKEIFHELEIMIFSCIILTFIGFIDNAYAFFHDQDEPKTRFTEESKKNIESLFDRVNNASTNYQNDIVTLNLSINNNNITLVKKNQEYIDNLKKIISSAKTVTVQQEYKSLLNNYLVSIESEMESYNHYNKYLLTGNLTENKISMDLLSKAFNYETQAINEYKQLVLQ